MTYYTEDPALITADAATARADDMLDFAPRWEVESVAPEYRRFVPEHLIDPVGSRDRDAREAMEAYDAWEGFGS